MGKISNEEANYKVKLQEWAQKNKMSFRYELFEDENPKSNHFVVELYIEDVLAGVGTALSKKEAQQLAAETAYRKLTPNNPLMKEIRAKKTPSQPEQEQEEIVLEETND